MPYIQLDLIDSLDALKTLDTAHFINYVKSILEDPVKDVR